MLQFEMVCQMADAFSMSKSNIVPTKESLGGKNTIDITL